MYKKTYAPDHHRADILGEIGVHLLEAEKKLKRPLQKGEIVHHLDFDKLNNSHTNFLITTRKEHQRIPEMQAKFLVAHGLMDDFIAWWKEHKDDIDETYELEKRLVKAELKAARMQRRLKK